MAIDPRDPLESIDVSETQPFRTEIARVKRQLFNIGEDNEDPKVQYKYYRNMAARYGDGFVIARRQDGSLWSWGCSAVEGQLGQDDITPTATPTQVSITGVDFSRVFAPGKAHTVALDVSGAPYTWGDNTYGQLGLDGFVPSRGVLGVGEIQGAGMDESGNVWTWGVNTHGNLGDGTWNTARSSPVTLVDSGPWKTITDFPTQAEEFCRKYPGHCRGIGKTGGNFLWLINEDGTLYTTGRGNFGQLGIGSFGVSRSSPVSVLGSGNQGYWQCSGGQQTMGCIDQSGEVWTWGRGSDGKLGIWGPVTGSPTSLNSPNNVHNAVFDNDPSNFFNNRFIKNLSVGNNFMTALDTGGRGWGWGNNQNGQLGNDDNALQNSPQSVHQGGLIFSQTAAGVNTSMWLDIDGNVWMSGDNDFGRLAIVGDPQEVSVPTIVKGTPHLAIKVAAGTTGQNFGFLRADGSLWLWGENDKGQIGIGYDCPEPTSPPCDSGGTDKVTSPASVIGSGQSYKFIDFWMGGNHTIAIDEDGQLWGWGSAPQIGNNSPTGEFPSPVQVSIPVSFGPNISSALEPLKVIGLGPENLFGNAAAGWNHTLVIDQDDSIGWGWGLNTSGQVGDGTLTNRSAPVTITLSTTGSEDQRFRKIAAGEEHSIALDQRGQVWAWGNNYYGQLGTIRNPLTEAEAVVGAGKYHGGAITNGDLWMWGFNSSGQIGDNTKSNRSTPTSVVGPQGNWMSITHPPPDADENLCYGQSPAGLCRGMGTMEDQASWAIKDEGGGETSLWTWGFGALGNLGTGSFGVSYSSPVSVLNSRDRGFWTCGASYDSICCIDKNWEVWCWGNDYGPGELGLSYPGSPDSFASPVNLPNAMNNNPPPSDFVNKSFKTIDKGSKYTMMVDTQGWAWATGQNLYGKLMVGDTLARNSPVSCISPPGWTGSNGWMDVAAAEDTTFFLTTNGIVFASGHREGGKMGMQFATSDTNSSPQVIWGYPHSAIKIETGCSRPPCGGVATGFLRADGSLWMWGDNSIGQLGLGNTTNPITSPTSVIGSGQSYKFVDFAIIESAVLAVDEDGQVWGWGHESANGTGVRVSYPVAISGLLAPPTIRYGSQSSPVALSAAPSDFIEVAAGSQSSYGIDTEGQLFSWGDNTYGQVGDDTTDNKSIPTSVAGRHSFIQIAGGGRESQGHACALKPDGSVWCWGRNHEGQLGVCDEVDRSSPESVVGNHSFIDVYVSKGGFQTIAIKLDGSVWVWGKDPFCDDVNYCSPVSVPDFNLILLNILGRGYFQNHSNLLRFS